MLEAKIKLELTISQFMSIVKAKKLYDAAVEMHENDELAGRGVHDLWAMHTYGVDLGWVVAARDGLSDNAAAIYELLSTDKEGDKK